MASMLVVKAEFLLSTCVVASLFPPVSVTVDLATLEKMWNYIYMNISGDKAAE